MSKSCSPPESDFNSEPDSEAPEVIDSLFCLLFGSISRPAKTIFMGFGQELYWAEITLGVNYCDDG